MPRVAAGFAVLLLAALALAGGAGRSRIAPGEAAGGEGPGEGSRFATRLPEGDLVLLAQMFRGRIYLYPDGTEERLLVPTFPSTRGLDPKSPRARAGARAREAFERHRRRLATDPAYRRRWESAEREILRRLSDERVPLPEGTRTVFAVLRETGLDRELLAGLVHPPVPDHPLYDGPGDPRIWGPPTAPFYRAVRVAAAAWPASVRPFHYCTGAGGLTVSGGTADPHVRAFLWLRDHDPEFRADWNAVLAAMAPALATADRLDPRTAERLTTRFRTLLLRGGEHSLAARIEARVRRQAARRIARATGP